MTVQLWVYAPENIAALAEPTLVAQVERLERVAATQIQHMNETGELEVALKLDETVTHACGLAESLCDDKARRYAMARLGNLLAIVRGALASAAMLQYASAGGH